MPATAASQSVHSTSAPAETLEARLRRVCVVGAGSSGLAVVKNLLAAGIPVDCLERESDLGGNWNYGQPASSVYRSTHLISSKRLTEYTDFPLPDDYPEFPHHSLVLKYFRAYADRFGLWPHIEFGAAVEQITRRAEGGWLVRLASGETRLYGRLVIANGHNWDPRYPSWAGQFAGLELHSSEYKTPELLEGRRVLVVGAGNSGCDIAVESAQHAAETHLTLRRGYHFLPKFFHGTPIDICGERILRWRFPLWLRRICASAGSFLVLGRPQWLGLPKPDHKLFETHPIINSQLIYYVGHGDIQIRPDVASVDEHVVHFSDGTRSEFDVIVHATGFKITIPFIDRAELNWQADRPELYLNVFHPERDDLFIAGLIQPDSGQWGLVDCQAQLIAKFLQHSDAGSPRAAWFRKVKCTPRKEPIRYVPSPRHLLEVEHFSYRRQMERLIKKLA
jgi:hypothetical protein